MLPEILAFLAVVVSSSLAGFVVAYLFQLRTLRYDLQAKILDFAEVTKQASAANLSLAEKLLHIDARLDNVDSWRSMIGSTINQTGWKK